MGRSKETGVAEGTIRVMVLGTEIDVDVEMGYTVSTPADPGRLSGPPEDCYPPTGAEWDLAETFDATIDGFSFTGRIANCRDAEMDALDSLVEQAIAEHEEDPRQYEKDDD